MVHQVELFSLKVRLEASRRDHVDPFIFLHTAAATDLQLHLPLYVFPLSVIKHAVQPVRQGWQVSANSGLNRGLNRFKPSWQKQVFAGFYQTWYNNCSIKIMLTV